MNINDSRVFAPSNTGTKAHAFMGSIGAKEGNLRAACRVTIQRSATETTFISLNRARSFYTVCDNCVRLYMAAEARAYNSMQPATEADDLGYVAPVDERTEQPQAEVQDKQQHSVRRAAASLADYLAATERGDAVAATRAAADLSTWTGIAQVHGATLADILTYREQPQADAERTPVPEQHADLSTEDGTVKLGRDQLTRRGHWADVTLDTGRTYSVSMLVHRKTPDGSVNAFGSRVLVDHVIYWSESDGRSTGPIRTASAEDKPGSVGGRIWSLLVAANIA